MSSVASSTKRIDGPILDSAGPATLLSRGWNLLRMHWKQCFLVILLPMVMQSSAALLMNLVSSGDQLSSQFEGDKGTVALVMVGLLVGAFGLLLLGYFAWIVALAVLSRLFYLALTEDRTASLKECFAAVGRRWLPLTLIAGLVVAVMFVCGALDMVLMILGVFCISLVGSFFSVALAALEADNYMILGLGLVLLLFLTFMVAGILFFVVLSVQSLFALLPVVSAMNAPRQKSFAGYARGFILLCRNFPRAMLFGSLMVVLTAVISIVVSFPAQAYIWFEFLMRAKGQLDPAVLRGQALPLNVMVITNLYSVITGSIQGPFLFVALTLFWYDCQVRSEGLALRLKLKRMQARLRARQKKPTDS